MRGIWAHTASARALTLVAAPMTLCLPASAGAAERTQPISIGIQPLSHALAELARQTGISVFAAGELTQGRRSASVSGSMAPEAALKIILQGSGLTYRRDSDSTYVVVRGPALIRTSATAPVASGRMPAPPAGEPAADQGGLAEIIVTAEKRETNLQDTPIAISVLGAADLEARHIVSIENIGGSVPALQLAPYSGRNSAVQVTIRGIGAQSDANQPMRDQGVGVYIDGIYLGRAQGLGTALYDIGHIEVLKGPQGTLFGRNTEGGAINIVTKKPTGVFSMDTTVGISNFSGYEAITHVNLPEFNNISIKVDALVKKRDGTVSNPMPGKPGFNMFNKRGIHAAALWKPTPDFSAEYAFDTSYDATTPYYQQLVSPGTSPLAPIFEPHAYRIDEAEIGVPLRLSVGKTWGHRLLLDWGVSPDLQIKSISSYRRLTQSQFANNIPTLSVFRPNGPLARDSQGNFRQRQYSQELQLIGDLPQLKFVLGAFYFDERVQDDAWSPNTLQFNSDGTGYSLLPQPTSSSPYPDRASHSRAKSAALFGQATWTPDFLNDIVHLTGGLRYTHDERQGTLEKVNGATPILNGVTAPLQFDDQWDRVDPMVNLAVDLSRNAMVYGRWATGYRSDGANTRSLTFRGFDPETVSTFEIGAKTEFFDRKARLNVAAYSTRLKDQQIDFTLFTAGVNRSTVETINTRGVAKIKGAEIELTLTPTKSLTISGSYAYIDAKLPPAPNILVPGSPLIAIYPIYTPKHSASGSIDYRFPIQNMLLRMHVDANYASTQHVSGNDASQTVDKAFLVNGRIALDEIDLTRGASLELALWSRNIFNEAHAIFRFASPAIGRQAIFNEPRTYGATASIQF